MKFFTHEISSRDDDRLFELIDIHGLEGYGFFWVILEELYRSEENGFQIEATNVWIKRLARSLNISDGKILVEYLDTLANLGLIDNQLWVNRVVRSQGVLKRSDAYMQRKAKEAEKKRRQRSLAKEATDNSGDVPRDIKGTASASLNVPLADPDPYTHSYTHSYSNSNSNSNKEEREEREALSFFPLTGGKEEKMQAGNSLSAQNSDQDLRPPNPQSPLSPAAPKNFPILKQAENGGCEKSKNAEIDALLKDDDFCRFLFSQLKKDTVYYSTYADYDYKKQSRKYIKRARLEGSIGDDRLEELREYKEAYDRYKAAKQQAEEEKLVEREFIPQTTVSEDVLSRLAEINADRKAKGFIFTEEDYEESLLKESSTIYVVSSRRAELNQNTWVAS